MAEVTARLAKREKMSAIVLSFFQILDLNSKLEERILSPCQKLGFRVCKQDNWISMDQFLYL